MISLQINGNFLKNINSNNSFDFTPVMKVFSERMVESVRDTFEVGGRPLKWKPSKAALREGRKTLIKTGALMNSINAGYTKTSTNVGFPTITGYGKKHQLGLGIEKRSFLPEKTLLNEDFLFLKDKLIFWLKGGTF